ncbi:polysaccharide export protein [Thalassobaculum fulvum]|uniref:Polysaccharide export protein n=1 Tax=Thalassobaculum fulvum TaxID=1633335 RepID=A0A918XMX7_9PROT|nr:polysaccharide biosynthesis/export family protein [Thalassobaculum fulvum]GHD40367.1 polysaccharide export protein [Thalassobaculum fulvum]
MACSADPMHRTEPPRRRAGGLLSPVLALAAALVLTACGSTPAPEEPTPPLAAYVIGAGDRVKVTVLEIKDMTVEADVADDGTIELPLVGSVRIAGRTAPEVRTALSERLARDFIKDPKVNVEVSKYRPFYVLGQVNRPGSYPFEPEIDIRRAVAIAGGFNRRADTSSAYLVRELGDRDDRRRVDLRTRVFPGDVIEVDRRLF